MKRAAPEHLRSVLLRLTLLVAPACAQIPVESAAQLSLDQAIREALSANLTLSALHEREVAAHLDARAVARTRLGRLEGVASYSRYKDDQIARPIARQLLSGGFANLPFDANQVHYGLTYTLPLYLGGQLSARIHIAQLAAEQAAALLAGTRWQLRFNTVSLYTGAVALGETEAAFAELEQVLEKTKTRLDLMVDQGKRPPLDRLKVIDQLAEIQAQRAAVQADATRVRGLLLALLGRTAEESLTLTPLPPTLPQLQASSEQLSAELAATSALRRARLTADQADEGIRRARADFLPSLSTSAQFFEHDGPDVAGGPLNTWEMSIGVRLPLFAGGSRTATLAAAQTRKRAAATQLAQTQLEVEARLQGALARFEAALSSHEAALQRQAVASEVARTEQIRYDTGAGAIEDLLRARSRQQQARAGLARAVGEVWVAAEQINALVEKEIVR